MTARGRLIHFPAELGVTVQLDLGFLKQLGRGNGGGVAPRPLAFRAITVPSFERA